MNSIEGFYFVFNILYLVNAFDFFFLRGKGKKKSTFFFTVYRFLSVGGGKKLSVYEDRERKYDVEITSLNFEVEIIV